MLVVEYPKIENFNDKYLELKAQHKTDLEIAKELLISGSLLKKYKVENKTPNVRKPRRNEQNVSEEEFAIALDNGLSRRLVLQRVRFHGWSNKRAITTPRGYQKRGKYKKRGTWLYE